MQHSSGKKEAEDSQSGGWELMRRKGFDSIISKRTVSGIPPKLKYMRRVFHTRVDETLEQN
ncbi:hypothetical protein E2C01_014078 [Portunus trituberculatus]|uniref:Uncharacterized protein n=1 Tax=Portunus trituberculatus TaxID=210409 RepID=A0A5B7DIX5_PORTR|nr:hypothetical protein [Portunus trituberculatus]